MASPGVSGESHLHVECHQIKIQQPCHPFRESRSPFEYHHRHHLFYAIIINDDDEQEDEDEDWSGRAGQEHQDQNPRVISGES